MIRQHSLKTAGVITLAVAGAGWSNQASAANVAEVYLNGQPLATSVAPLQVNGRTLVPMRDIFESLGAEVSWDNQTQDITAQRGTTAVKMQIGNRIAWMNGQQVTLDQPALLYQRSTMVPLRFVSEALGAQVSFDGARNLVSIVSAGRPNLALGQPAPGSGHAVAGARTISIPGGAVVPVTMDSALSSATSRVGDRFTATVATERMGDSEFPVNSKLEGMVVEARPHTGDNPGVLDLEFRNVILPDGRRQPLQGQLVGLDNTSVITSGGRIVARNSGSSSSDRLKIVGIGAGAGFVLGKVLGTNSTVTTVLGAAGGYLYGRQRDKNRAAEAVLPRNARIGVRLDGPVSYADSTGYSDYRMRYLRTASYNSTGLAGDNRGGRGRNRDYNNGAYNNGANGAYNNSPDNNGTYNNGVYNNGAYNNGAYNAPAYNPPVQTRRDDDPPAYNPPVYSNNPPVYNNAPVYNTPARPDPGYNAPAYNQPSYSNQPSYNGPAYNQPDYNRTAQAPPAYGYGQDASRSVAGYRTISVPDGAVVPVTLDRSLSSGTSHVGDVFTTTVVSQRLGDSEFPNGSRLEGTVVEARPRNGDEPGVLDLEFRNVIFPDGSRHPLQGYLTALDDNSVMTSAHGRIMARQAKPRSRGDNLKVIGIGAGAGFLLGKLLKKNSTVTAAIGALGGYLYGKHQDSKDQSAEAVVPQGTRLGVRLDGPVTYADTTGYSRDRLTYLRM